MDTDSSQGAESAPSKYVPIPKLLDSDIEAYEARQAIWQSTYRARIVFLVVYIVLAAASLYLLAARVVMTPLGWLFACLISVIGLLATLYVMSSLRDKRVRRELSGGALLRLMQFVDPQIYHLESIADTGIAWASRRTPLDAIRTGAIEWAAAMDRSMKCPLVSDAEKDEIIECLADAAQSAPAFVPCPEWLHVHFDKQ